MSEVSLESLSSRRKDPAPPFTEIAGQVFPSRTKLIADTIDNILGEKLKNHLGIRSSLEIQLLRILPHCRRSPQETFTLYSTLLNPDQQTQECIIAKTSLFLAGLKAGCSIQQLDCLVTLINREHPNSSAIISKELDKYSSQLISVLTQAEPLGLDEHLVRTIKIALKDPTENAINVLYKSQLALEKFKSSSYSEESKAFAVCASLLGWHFETIAEFFESMRDSPPKTKFIQEFIDLALQETRSSELSVPDGYKGYLPISLQLAYRSTSDKNDISLLYRLSTTNPGIISKEKLLISLAQIRQKEAPLSNDLETLLFDGIQYYQEQGWKFEPLRALLVVANDESSLNSLKNKLLLSNKINFPIECLPDIPEAKLSMAVLRKIASRYEAIADSEASAAAASIKLMLKEADRRNIPEDVFLDSINKQGHSLDRHPYQQIKSLSTWVHSYRKGTSFAEQEEETILDLIRANSPERMKEAGDEFSRLVTSDAVPYRLPAKGPKALYTMEEISHRDLAQKMTDETFEVMTRALDHAYGFNSLTSEARSFNAETPWTLIRFGLDCCEETLNINSSTITKFPGKGVALKGIKVNSIFPSNPLAPLNDKDPFEAVKSALPWCAQDFDRLDRTTYVFTRGLVAVIPPEEELFSIKGTHYSYLVFNQHFFRKLGDRAFLIPTDVLCSLLDPCLSSYLDSPGFDSEIEDATNIIPSVISILDKAADKLINLGWGSNIGGGLCNAFMPRSAMYHEWEISRRNETKDKYGHIHKSHITGNIFSQLTPEKERLLQPLREAHAKVYETSTSLLNLLDLARFALAQYHKGFSTKTSLEELDVEEKDLLLGQEDAEQPSEFLVGLPRLKEIYLINREFGEDGKNIPSRCPIMCIADVTDYSGTPDSRILLDTHNMTLYADHRAIQLPKDDDGSDPITQGLWKKYVVPHLTFEKDLRLLDRALFPEITTGNDNISL